ncbi:uncharacterized protein [Diabrotica undecimpunctata]|uniref:uncharacterized protein n=1 Tax=Diabrotica undecimpunctata TaxID=50387 RepID=UPI003B63462B
MKFAALTCCLVLLAIQSFPTEGVDLSSCLSKLFDKVKEMKPVDVGTCLGISNNKSPSKENTDLLNALSEVKKSCDSSSDDSDKCLKDIKGIFNSNTMGVLRENGKNLRESLKKCFESAGEKLDQLKDWVQNGCK